MPSKGIRRAPAPLCTQLHGNSHSRGKNASCEGGFANTAYRRATSRRCSLPARLMALCSTRRSCTGRGQQAGPPAPATDWSPALGRDLVTLPRAILQGAHRSTRLPQLWHAVTMHGADAHTADAPRARKRAAMGHDHRHPENHSSPGRRGGRPLIASPDQFCVSSGSLIGILICACSSGALLDEGPGGGNSTTVM